MTRIAVVYDSFFPINSGGGERVYRRLSEVLVERGHAVDYLTRNQWSAAEAPIATFDVVPIWRGEIYDAQGTRTTSSAIRFAAAAFVHLWRTRGRYDIVVASALPVLTLIAARAALFGSGTFLVADWLEVWGWKKWLTYAGRIAGALAYILQFIGARSADLHMVNSSFTAGRLVAVARGSQPLILGLVDLADAKGEVRGADDPPYLLAIGRLIADKRFDVLPAALVAARLRVPGLLLRIVGAGPEIDTIRTEIRRAGLTESIEILGRVSEENLQQLFAGAAALVNPSAREGFGLVIAEAAAFGVPSIVVAGEDNAAADLIRDGVNGYVASSVSAPELGIAIADGVLAGPRIRTTTLEWFEEERKNNGINMSVDALLQRYKAAS